MFVYFLIIFLSQTPWLIKKFVRIPYFVLELVVAEIIAVWKKEKKTKKNSREIIVSSKINMRLQEDFGPNLQHQYIWQDHSLASENFQNCGCNLWCWFFGNAFLKTLQTVHRLAARLVPYLAVSIPSHSRRSRGWGGSPSQNLGRYIKPISTEEGEIMPTKSLLDLKDFQNSLRPCKWSKHQKLIRNFTN